MKSEKICKELFDNLYDYPAKGKFSRRGFLKSLPLAAYAASNINYNNADAHDLAKVSNWIPHVAVGSDYRTTIELVNSGDDNSGIIEFWDDFGNPMVVNFNKSLGSSFPYSVKKGGSLSAYTDDLGQTKTGYVLVKSNNSASNLGAGLSFTYYINGQRGVLPVQESPLSAKFCFPAVTNLKENKYTGVALLNPNNSPATVEIDIRRADGSSLLTSNYSITIPSNHKISKYLHEMVLGLDNYQGDVAIFAKGSDGKDMLITATALQQDGNSFLTVPLMPDAAYTKSQAQVSGSVRTLDGKPVMGQDVIVESSGIKQTVKTNSFGNYKAGIN